MAMATKAGGEGEKHFVLVHGACHGAWSWYKLKPLLESTGHLVTPLDMAASGVHMKAIQDVHSVFDYSEPLLEFMASLAPNKKVILVGHSFGGVSLALAMDKFPEKVSVAVFVAALMPDTIHPPSHVVDEFNRRMPVDAWLDTQFATYGNPEEPLMSFLIGHEDMSSKAYHQSPIEDLELAKALVRPGSFFRGDLSKAKKFSNDSYGLVPRVYVVCELDMLVPYDFQQWMIENCGVTEAMMISGADHLPMFSKPKVLCDYLVEIAHKYA